MAINLKLEPVDYCYLYIWVAPMNREYASEICKIKYTKEQGWKIEKSHEDEKEQPFFFRLIIGDIELKLNVRTEPTCFVCQGSTPSPVVMGRIYYPTTALYGEDKGLGEYGTICFGNKETEASVAKIIDTSIYVAGQSTDLGSVKYCLQKSYSKWDDFMDISHLYDHNYNTEAMTPFHIDVNRTYVHENSQRRLVIFKDALFLDANTIRVMENIYGGPVTELPRALFYLHTNRYDMFTEGWYYANINFAMRVLQNMKEFADIKLNANELFMSLPSHKRATVICYAFSLFVSQMTYKPDGFEYLEQNSDEKTMNQFEWFCQNAALLTAGDCEDFAILIYRMCRQLQSIEATNDLVKSAQEAIRQYVPCNALVKAHAASLKFQVDNPDLQFRTKITLQTEKMATDSYGIFHMTVMLVPINQFKQMLGNDESVINDVDEDDNTPKRVLFAEGTVCLYPDIFEKGIFTEDQLSTMRFISNQSFKDTNLLMTPTFQNSMKNNMKHQTPMYGNVLQLCTDSLINESNFNNENAVYSSILNVVADLEESTVLAPLTEHFFDEDHINKVHLIPDLHIRNIVPAFSVKHKSLEGNHYLNLWALNLELLNPTLHVDIEEYEDEIKKSEFKLDISKCKTYRNGSGFPYLPFNMSMQHCNSRITIMQGS